MENESAQTSPVSTTVQEDPVTPVSFREGLSNGKLLFLFGAVVSVVLGLVLGYVVASRSTSSGSGLTGDLGSKSGPLSSIKPEDLRDTASGVIEIKPDKDKKTQGSHILKRDDSQFPVYLISNRVDLTTYEKKHMKVLGVTNDCGKGLWCMEVNKVE